MNEEERIKQIEGWLRLIDRTRLLCNTSEELSRLVGFSVGKRNSLARKGGSSLFMKEAIFHQMAFICREQTGLNLQNVIESYEDVDNFIDRYESRLNNKEIPSQLVRLFYGNGDPETDMSFVRGRLELRHVPILMLMLLGCLPRLSAKYGDVLDINADFRRVFDFLRKECQVPSFQTIPLLTMEEQKVAATPDYRTRIQLIASMTDILNTFGALSTQLRLSVNTREFLKDQFIPDIEGIWTEDDSLTSFWYFERLVNGYNMYHYTLRDNQQTLSYIKYFISFYSEDSEPMAIVVHPKMTRYMVTGQPVPPNIFAYLDFEQTDDKLHFTPKGKDGEWFRLSDLIRSTHAKFYQTLLNDDNKKKVNEYASDDYELLHQMVAITTDAIYLKHRDQGYYKVPKSLNEVLEDIHFGDNVGILTFLDATYIAFDDKSIYYDVTSEEKMHELGIIIVSSITE